MCVCGTTDQAASHRRIKLLCRNNSSLLKPGNSSACHVYTLGKNGTQTWYTAMSHCKCLPQHPCVPLSKVDAMVVGILRTDRQTDRDVTNVYDACVHGRNVSTSWCKCALCMHTVYKCMRCCVWVCGYVFVRVHGYMYLRMHGYTWLCHEGQGK